MRASAVALLLGLRACLPLPEGSESSSSSGGSSGTSGTSASGRLPLDVQKLCTRLVDECGQPLTTPECVKTFSNLRVTAACIDAIPQASCADLGSSNSSVLNTCFPPCSGTLAACNADGTLTFCTVSGTTQVADCQGSCVTEGFSIWSGVCGTTFDGGTSARPQCWCK